jgi:hypothetical protein
MSLCAKTFATVAPTLPAPTTVTLLIMNIFKVINVESEISNVMNNNFFDKK